MTQPSDLSCAADAAPASPTQPAWARQAAQVSAQQWPAPALYVVATPIGNLGDMSLRAVSALQQASAIAVEDTRTTRPLLDAWGINTPLITAHRHNEAQAAAGIVARLQAGERVALVSDAGTPAVSDPGARIVRAARDAGFRVVPIPGASAAMAALMASGSTSDENPAFVFAGFAPPKSAARQTWLRRWCAMPAPVVIYESPHRVAATLADLLTVCGPTRDLTLARELTKRFEEIATVPMAEAAAWLTAHPQRAQGEFVLIVAAPPPDEDSEQSHDELLGILLESVSVRDAARVAARLTGTSRDTLYARALALREAAQS